MLHDCGCFQYLKETLGEFVRHVIESDFDCEVDPARLANNSELAEHQAALMSYCQTAWGKVINSQPRFPR